MIRAREAFRELMNKSISPFLKSKGFHRRGYKFSADRKGNLQIVYFGVDNERSSDSVMLFSITLGIISSKLRWFETGHVRPHRIPLPQDWHWATSLAELATGNTHLKSDGWWSIQRSDQVPSLGEEIRRDLQDFGLPALDAHVTDESLRDQYRSGRGGTEFQILYRLAYLLLTVGPLSELDQTLEKLKSSSQGFPWAATAEEYASRIEAMRKVQ